MKYIVFDLEWNQSPNGKRFSNQRLPFEIIEIGAVCLDEQLHTLLFPLAAKYVSHCCRGIHLPP